MNVTRIGWCVGLAFVLAAGTGCQTRYPFKLECTVQDDKGKPLEGVKAVLDIVGSADTRDQPDAGEYLGVTGTSGRVDHSFQAGDASQPNAERRWYLKLSRDGFYPQRVDVSPLEWPKSGAQATPIILLARMIPIPIKQPK